MRFERLYDLKLASGRRAHWNGVSPEDAARRYVDTHRTETVVALRYGERHGLFVDLPSLILEPGDPGW